LIQASPILTNETNPFGHHTMKVRVPGIIREVQRQNPDYPAPIQHALDKLHDDLQSNAPIPPLELPAPDYDNWEQACADHAGATWLNTDWFFAEIYFYRLLIQAVRWWETGRDPFAPQKAAEVASASLWEVLELALAECEKPIEERLIALFQHTLWGNRIDLSHVLVKTHGSTWVTDDLLIDDSARALARLLGQRGAVHFINDNAGTELALDLALADALLETVAERVIFHVKMHPMFVSDAIPADVLAFIGRLEQGSPAARGLAERLRTAFVAGRFSLAPDLYWNSSRFLWNMPARLTRTFERASLVVVKGDLNYRRMTGDALWPHATPIRDVVNYFPAPLLSLRTLKSDVVVGLPEGMAAQLDQLDKDWRTNGRRGVIQYVEAARV
jgi:hypothetical protein